MTEISHRRGTPFHIRWSYGADLSDVAITAVVSGDAGEVARLKVLRCEGSIGEVDLIAAAEETRLWPIGPLALDVLLLRGDVSGRLDTVLVDIQQGAGA